MLTAADHRVHAAPGQSLTHLRTRLGARTIHRHDLLSALRAILRVRLGQLVGVTLLLVALLHYRSDEHRPVLGRWSYPHTALIVGVAGLWLLALRHSWRAT